MNVCILGNGSASSSSACAHVGRSCRCNWPSSSLRTRMLAINQVMSFWSKILQSGNIQISCLDINPACNVLRAKGRHRVIATVNRAVFIFLFALLRHYPQLLLLSQPRDIYFTIPRNGRSLYSSAGLKEQTPSSRAKRRVPLSFLISQRHDFDSSGVFFIY